MKVFITGNMGYVGSVLSNVLIRMDSNIEIIASIFIVLGSIPFISYLKFIKGNRKILFHLIDTSKSTFIN